MSFDKRWSLERHLLERHSDFCWKCSTCKKLFQRRCTPHGNCKVAPEDMICFQNSTGLRGKEAEEKLEEHRKTLTKHMLLKGPDGELLDLQGNLIETQSERKRKVVSEKGDSSEQKRRRVVEVKKDSSSNENIKEKEDKLKALKKVWAQLGSENGSVYDKQTISEKSVEMVKSSTISTGRPTPQENVVEENTKSSSSSGSSSSSSSSSSATQQSKTCISQTVREESVERITIDSRPINELAPVANLTEIRPVGNDDVVDAFLASLQETQENVITLNIGGMKYETSKTTLRADPSSVFALMQSPVSPFRPSNGIYFFDRDSEHFKIILGYLRNGCIIEKRWLPREPVYLYELLLEARFYKLLGLASIVEERLNDMCVCKYGQ